MPFTPNLLSQRDPRWKDEKLGFHETYTIATDGCTLTCLTMLVNGYGLAETPSTMNRKLKELGSGIGFLGSLIVWPGLTRAFPRFLFQKITTCRDRPAPVDEINSSLDAGQALIVEIEPSPVSELQYHWVVLHARQGDDYSMLDPWSLEPSETTLAARYGYGRPLAEIITAVVWFADKEAVPAPEPASILAPALEPAQGSESASVPVEMPSIIPSGVAANPAESGSPVVTSGLTALVAQDIGSVGLRLRDQPSSSSNTLAVLSAGEELAVLEPAEQAIPKIGQVNQWLNVCDESGNSGYVAAWYLKLSYPSAPGQAPKPLTVLVSSQASAGLRLRDRPSAFGNILEVLMPGTLLTVLESASTAKAKIGVVNQWLKVKLPGGMTGYVAAWYVTA